MTDEAEQDISLRKPTGASGRAMAVLLMCPKLHARPRLGRHETGAVLMLRELDVLLLNSRLDPNLHDHGQTKSLDVNSSDQPRVASSLWRQQNGGNVPSQRPIGGPPRRTRLLAPTTIWKVQSSISESVPRLRDGHLSWNSSGSPGLAPGEMGEVNGSGTRLAVTIATNGCSSSQPTVITASAGLFRM